MPPGMELGIGPGDFVCVRWGSRSPPQIFGPCLLWPNGCMDLDATCYIARHRPTRHCVRWRPSSPPLKGHSPQFSVNVRCGQMAGWTKMSLCMEVGLGPGDCVRCGHSYHQKKGTQLLAHVYCGQTAGWMKTPLGTEVDLGSAHVVLDGVTVLCEGAQQLPLFSAHVYCGHGRPSQLLLSFCF